MTETNTGLIKNTANIEITKNENLVEDSKKENNESYANIIITVSTGEKTIIAIGIISLSIILIVGSGITLKRQKIKKQ